MASTLKEDSDTSSSSASITALSASADSELRVPCFCEENVWRLAYRKLHSAASAGNSQAASSKYFAVFISNPSKCVCFFHQLANPNPLTPVFWDYHVLLFEQQQQRQSANHTTLVWDIDSYLPYPCPLADYLDNAFPALPTNQERDDGGLVAHELEQIAPCFRVVPAETFLTHFSCDRSHMWDATKKKWRAPPPTYPAILPNGNQENNLMTYINMTTNQNDAIYGSVLNRQQLEARFLQ